MSGPPGSEHTSEHDPRRGRHRKSATGATWTPHVPGGPPHRGRHSLTPEEQNAVTGPLPLASLPISHPPARHDLEHPPKPSSAPARQIIEWPSAEPDAPRQQDDFGLGGPWAVDPFADTASLGLRKFNIGTVPASVTPPVSSKRAAWFSVAAAAGALVSLIAVSSAFVGPPKSTEQIGALPGVPPFSGEPSFDTNIPPPDGFRGKPSRDNEQVGEDRRNGDDGGRHQAPETETGERQPADRDTDRPGAPGSRDPIGSRLPGSPSGPPGSGGGPGSGGTGTAPAPPPAPPEIIIAKPPPNQRGVSRVDGQQIASRSLQYFDLVTSDPEAAHAMTVGPLHSEGSEGIRQRYANVSSIRVKTVHADPRRALTTNLITITKTDGSTITKRRTLCFTPSGNPKIRSDD